jgi:ligand-binding sensor domain-containing protein
MAGSEIQSESHFRFNSVTLDATAPSGVDPVASPASFVDFTEYQERLWLSGPAGLYGFDRNGDLVAKYRPGMELPPVELGGISAGLDGGPRLFIATHGEGLLEFDGRSIRGIRPEDAGARMVTCVLALQTGRVIFGTEKRGALVFDGQTIAPISTALAAAHITALAGTEGDLWIGTLAGGVWHSHAGQLDHFNAPSDLPDLQVLSLASQGDSAWVGTPLGVVEFRDGKRTRALAGGYFARSLDVNGDGLRVGTEDEGVFEVALTADRRSRQAESAGTLSAAVQRVRSVGKDVLALTPEGLFASRGAAWNRTISGPGAVLSDRNIAALAQDSAGRLWVGYFDRGLDIVDGTLDRVTHHEDQRVFCVNRIVASSDQQRIAVATANGLVMFDSGGTPRQVLGREQGLLADHVTDVAFSGSTIIAATSAGISFIDRDGIRSLYAFQGLVNNHVYTIGMDGGRVLAGTLGGLSVIQDRSVLASYTTANSHLRHNWITALEKVDGEWFAGTYGSGVQALDAAPNGTAEWRGFPDLPKGMIVNPNALAASATRVYAGSLGDGLFVYDRAQKRWSRARVGLPSLNVTALTTANGYLYAGTDNGLVRMREEVVR